MTDANVISKAMALVGKLDADVILEGIDVGIEKGAMDRAKVGSLLRDMVAAEQRASETYAKALVRVAVGPDGRGGTNPVASGLFKRERAMPGREHFAQQALDAHYPATFAKAEADTSPLGKFNAMTSELRKRDPGLSEGAATEKAMATPEALRLYRADREARLGTGF